MPKFTDEQLIAALTEAGHHDQAAALTAKNGNAASPKPGVGAAIDDAIRRGAGRTTAAPSNQTLDERIRAAAGRSRR